MSHFLWARNLGAAQQGGFGSWCLTRLWSNVSGHCDYLKACLRLEVLLPGWLPLVAVGRGPQFLISPESCLNVL